MTGVFSTTTPAHGRHFSTLPLAQALGAGTIRDVLFHALSDTQGWMLMALTQMGQPEARIADLQLWAENQDEARLDTNTLAARADISAATLHRYFRSVTGHPPSRYVKRQKLLCAEDLLRVQRLTVAQAADAIGYGDPANFSRATANCSDSHRAKIGKARRGFAVSDY